MPRSGKRGLTINYGEWPLRSPGEKNKHAQGCLFWILTTILLTQLSLPPKSPYNPLPCFPQRPGRVSKLSFWKFDINCSSVASAFQTLWPCWKSLGQDEVFAPGISSVGTKPPALLKHGRNGQGLLTMVSQVSSNPSPAAYMSGCPSMPLLCPITSFSFISQRKEFYYQEKRLQQCLPSPGTAHVL